MPETTVHEDRDALFGKQEINPDVGRACCPSAPLLTFDSQSLLSSPSGDAVSAQQSGECKLRVLVAASANPRHYLGAFVLPVAGSEAIPVSINN